MHGDQPIQISPVWTVAERQMHFVRLAPDQTFPLAQPNCYVKVITGRLRNIDRGCLAEPFKVRSTATHVDELVSGPEGALFATMTRRGTTAPLTDMNQLVFKGHMAEHLTWNSFEAKFSRFIDAFDGLDCHMADGIHLADEHGDEIVYVNFWTCGKGVDLTTHNHGGPPSPMAPAFVEVHWVLNQGTGTGGMYQSDKPGATERVRYPMQEGDEHGPYYDLDPQGLPCFADNGAVVYPWHGWQGGEDGKPGQSYDFVAAFEINPAFIEASC
jgi:hypothetical protein